MLHLKIDYPHKLFLPNNHYSDVNYQLHLFDDLHLNLIPIQRFHFDMCKFLKLKGPVCLQMKDDDEGNPKFIEVNPRFGGGTYFTTLAGVNFMKIIFDVLENKEILINEPKLIKVLRYYKEVII